jgi:hypothetical protein
MRTPILLLASVALVAESPTAIHSPEQAFTILKNASSFATIDILPKGPLPSEYFALAYLIRHKEGSPHFERLLGEGKMPGRLYALIGLYATNPTRFRAELPNFEADNRKVFYYSGCVNSEMPCSWFVRSKEPGRLVLPPGQLSMKPYYQKNFEFWSTSYAIDISGGGYTASILDAVNDA